MFSRALPLVVLVGAVASALSFSQTVSQTPTSDPQAVAVLAQTLKAAGGTRGLGSIQDFAASGTITYFWAGEQVQGSATVRGRGSDQFRLDATLAQGTRTIVLNHGLGKLKETSGSVKGIPYHNTLNSGVLTFPYLTLAGLLNDPLTTASYAGLAQAAGRQAHQVRVQRHFSSAADPDGTLAKLCTTDYFLDAASGLVLKTSDMTHPIETTTENYSHDVEFENYVTTDGIAVPMLVREKVGGQTIWELRLSAISFNNGLTDLHFALQ